MIHLHAGRRRCVFCGEDFSRESVRWLIDEEADKGLWSKEREQSPNASTSSKAAPLRDAMDRFLRLDYMGQSFFHMVSGQGKYAEPPKQVRLVIPEEDLSPAASPERRLNRYTTPEGREADIFCLGHKEGDVPCLRFTEEFIDVMEASGIEQLRHQGNRRYIEEICIRPVCPHCTSYLPPELLTESPDVFLARFALVGPIAAGKTTMNLINLALDQFNHGAWSRDKTGISGRSHYLASNYYEQYLRDKKLPTRTPKDIYIPPLLVRLTREKKRVLVVLMDVAGELLEQIEQDMEKGEKSERKVYAARELLRQMDGYLLMLDGEKEFLPKLGYAADNQDPPEVKLADLVPICRRFVSSGKKPAALVLTKCERFFTEGTVHPIPPEAYQKAFPTFGQLETALWQQPEPSAGNSGYSARHHEAIQFFFKPIIRKHFRELWNQAANIFSRVDVFPESNWGHASVNGQDLAAGTVNIKSLEPFYSAAPVFWLLDVINDSEPPEA